MSSAGYFAAGFITCCLISALFLLALTWADRKFTK